MGGLWPKSNNRKEEPASSEGGGEHVVLGKRRRRVEECLARQETDSYSSDSAMGGLLSSKGKEEEDGKGEMGSNGKKKKMVSGFRVKEVGNPVVLRRSGSMYFDEDGDLAHEFYQEERVVNSAGVVRWAMRRVFDNLTPQGQVDYVYPRLHTNLPVVLIETVAMHAVQTNL